MSNTTLQQQVIALEQDNAKLSKALNDLIGCIVLAENIAAYDFAKEEEAAIITGKSKGYPFTRWLEMKKELEQKQPKAYRQAMEVGIEVGFKQQAKQVGTMVQDHLMIKPATLRINMVATHQSLGPAFGCLCVVCRKGYMTHSFDLNTMECSSCGHKVSILAIEPKPPRQK